MSEKVVVLCVTCFPGFVKGDDRVDGGVCEACGRKDHTSNRVWSSPTGNLTDSQAVFIMNLLTKPEKGEP